MPRILLSAVCWLAFAGAAVAAQMAPLPQPGPGQAVATFAGGCFWCTESDFDHVPGVISTTSGYTGGKVANPSYEQVSAGGTGHAESEQVTFDPNQISLGKILQIYFSVAHNPTELNYQGPDSGTQYRSAIFTTSDDQKKVADAYIAQLNAAKVYKKPIVTKVGPLEGFYPAEAYHQDYLTLHPNQPYIAYNDIPKVENLKKIFAQNYIEKPTLVSDAKVTN